MFCRMCGTQLPDDSIFCSSCGARLAGGISTPAQTAPRGDYAAPSYDNVPMDPPYGGSYGQTQNCYQPTGQLIMDAGKVVVYNGTKTIGVTYGDGFLYVYDDRLEFHKKHGTMAGMGINVVVGMAVSAVDAKKNPVDTWYYSDIAEVYTAKHVGLIGKICIKFNNGKGYSITLSEHGSKTNALVEELCNTINQYL